MEPKTRKFASISATTLACVLLALPAVAQDKKAAPAAAEKKAAPAAVPAGTVKKVVDNDKVLVTEVTFKPGQGSPAQERPPRVVRGLSDGTMERTYPDGKTEKVEWKTGQVRYFAKDNFGNKNVGKTDVVLYIVQPK
jgi:hypothetical protein